MTNFKKLKDNWIKNIWKKLKNSKNIVEGIEQEDLYQNFYKKYKKYPEDFFNNFDIDWKKLEELYNIECLKKYFLNKNLVREDKKRLFNKKHYIHQLSHTEVPEDCLMKIAGKLDR